MSSFLRAGSGEARIPASASKVQFSSVPVSGEFESMLGGVAGVSLAEIYRGRDISLINSCDEICGGVIGSTGTKFCGKNKDLCEIKSHAKKRYQDMIEGLYVKVGEDELLCYPVIPKESVTEGVAREFLDRAFGSADEIVQYFDFVLSRENTSKTLVFEDLDQRKQEVNEAMANKTPAKRRKTNDVFTEFSELQARLLSEETEPANVALLDKTKVLVSFLLGAVMEDQEMMRVLLEKINVLILQAGSWPMRSKVKAPASLWLAIASLYDDVKRLEEENLKGGLKEVTHSDLRITEDALAEDMGQLRSDTLSGLGEIEGQIDSVKGPSFSPHIHYSNIADISDSLSTLEREFKMHQAEVFKQMKEAKDEASRNESSAGLYSVRYGRYAFSSIAEVGAWAEETFEGTFPFGAFVDVYSVLQRVTSYKDVAPSTELKNMEMLKKLSLSADAGLAIESFKHPLPKVFRGSSSDMGLGKGWLPGIPTPERWEDHYGLSGARVSIKSSMEEIRSRLESLIMERLRDNAEGQALARQMLSDTLNFITALCEFVSETYRNLELAGFSKAEAWQLVSKLVHRIFAKDCHMKRGAVSEVLDVSDTRVLGTGILWATFATHQVMREYMRHGIENHPSMASEYVRFLVANSGLSKIDKMESRLKALEEENKILKRDVAQADKAAKSAANKAEEAKLLAKKR